MKKNTLTSKKMLLASIVALAACGTIAMQTNAAPPTPAGTSPTFTFGAEQNGAGSAANQVSYIDSEGAIKHAIVNITTQTPKYWLDQSNTGSMDLLGTGYDVSAASLNGVTRYSTYDSVHENAGQLVNGSPYLIANIDNVTGTIYFSTLTENKNINVDFLNNKFSANVGGFNINSDKDNPVTVNITSNIIGNSGPTNPENYGNTNNIYYLKNGNFNFQGDIIGNNFTTKYENNGIILLSDSNQNDNNTLNFTGNVLGNNLVSTGDYVSGGIINDHVASGKTSTIEGIFANNYASGYKGLNGGVLRIGAAENSTATIQNSLFSGNTAALSTNDKDIHGGVIYSSAAEGANVNIVNTDFVNNKNERITDHNSSDSGMVIYHTGDGTLNITDSNFVGNTTNSKYSSHVVYSAGDVVVNAQNEDVLFSDNTRTNAESGKIYDIYLSNNAKSLTLNASDGHSITLTNGINATTLNVNTGSGATGTVITKLPNSNIDVLNLNAGTLNVLANDADPNFDTRVSHMYVGATPTLDLRNDTIDSFNITYTGAEPALALYGSTTSANVKLNIDYDGSVGTYGSADKLSFSDEAKVADNITVTLNDVNVISDSAFDDVSGNINYVAGKYTNVNGENYLGEVTQANSIDVVTDSGYTYHFFTGGTYNDKLNFTREYTGGASSLPAVIQDATTDSFSVTTDGFNAFEGTAYTSLGAINTGKNSFTINGNGRGIDGNYGSTPTKGGGVTVGSGQTLNLNNVNTSNFSTFATTTMADADNKGTINVSGGASSSAANVYDNNLDFMNDGNLNFTGGYVTLNGGISNSLSTAVNGAKNGSTTIQDGAHVTLGSNAVLAQNNLTIGSGGEFTASTDQLNGIGQLAGSSVHNISNQGTLNISAGSNTLTTRINDTGNSTGTIRLLGDITSSSTVRAANLDLNGNTYTLGSSGAKLFLLGAENGSIVAYNTGDMQLTSPGSSTIDITDVTIDGLAYITLDGRIKADASKIMNIGNDIRLYSGTKLTLIGDTNTSSFVDFAGNGDVTIADSMTNSGTFANHSLTINAKDSENNTISFTTDADKLQTETTITNGGRLVLTGNVQDAYNSGLLSQSISGDGKTVIDGNIVLDSSNNNVIGQNIEITAGGNSLDAYVNKFTGNVSVGGQVGNTGDYSSIILHGTSTDTPYVFNQSITGDGYAEISNDLNLSLGSNGSISNVLNNGILTAALTQVGGVENNGTFNTHGTMNGRTILGTGTTVLNGDLNLSGDNTIAGILNMNGQTINMQQADLSGADPANIYPPDTLTPATYDTLTVGSLTGNGNLKIDVDMTNDNGHAAHNDQIIITDGTSNNGTLTLTSVNITEATTTTTSSTPISNYITFVTTSGEGTLEGLNINVGGIFGGTPGVATITSDGYRYIFTQNSENANALDVTIQNAIISLSEFIQGDDMDGRFDEPDITSTTFSLVDNLTVTDDLGTTSRTAYNSTHQSDDPTAPNYDENVPIYELNVFLNGHTLSGTSTTTTDPNTGDEVTTKTGGVIVGNGYTLNISGTDSNNADAVGTMSKFDTAVTVNQGGLVNITDMKFENNNTDIVNNATITTDEGSVISGLVFTGDNTVETINGTGGTVIGGNLAINNTANNALTQGTVIVAGSGSLTANANALAVANGITNYGTVNLGSGNLHTNISGNNGTTHIAGDVVAYYQDGDNTIASAINQNVVIDGNNSLKIYAGLVGAVTNEAGTLKLVGADEDDVFAGLVNDVTGDGTTEIVSGKVVNSATIANKVVVDNGALLASNISDLTSDEDITNDGDLVLYGDYDDEDGYVETTLNNNITYDTVKGTTTFNGLVTNEDKTINNNVVNEGYYTNDEDGTITGDVDNEYVFINNGTINQESGEDTTLINNGTFTNAGEVTATTINNNEAISNTGKIEADTINNSSDAYLYNGQNQNNPVAEIIADIVNEGYAYNIGYINGDVDNVGGGVLVNGVTQDDEGNIISTDTDNRYGVINGNVTNTAKYGDVPVEYTADQIPAGSESEYIDQGNGVYYHNTSGDNDNPVWDTEVIADAGTVVNGGAINGDVANEGTFMNGSYLGEELEGAQINADKVENTGTFLNAGEIVADDYVTNFEDGTFVNNGSVDGDIKNEDKALFVNNGTVEGDVDNSDKGQFYNAEDSKIKGDVDNEGEGVFQNDGTIVGDVENRGDGQVLNNGDIYGWADNYGDGKFTNNGLVDTTVRAGSQYVYNEGSYTNNGDIIGGLKNDGDFINNGTIDGTGTDSDYIKNYDDITNTGVMTAAEIYNDGDFNNGIDKNGQNLGGGTINGDIVNDDLIRNAGVINGDINNDDYGTVSLADGGTVNGSVTGGGDLELDRGNGTVTGDVDVEDLSFNNDYDIEGDLGTLTVGGNLNAEYTGVSEPGATLNVQNGQATTSNLGGIYLGESLNYAVDADISNAITDAINGTYDEYSNPDATINISSINVVNDNNKAGKTQLDMFAGDEESRAALKDHISAGDLKDFLVNPIFKYSGSYNSNDGMLTIDKNFNPAVLVAPVAAQLGGYANMLNSYDEAFRNMDMYMLMTKAERQALKLRNKYASIDQNKVYDPTHTVYDNTSGWMRPYATFESVRLRRGPKVSNVAYGSYFGGESEMKDLGHGWDGMWGAYIGYNGSHQAFQGNSIYQNGGTIGLVGMAYKDNFFTGLTINAGANAAEASTMYGHEDFNMLMAGIASKTGYNWELAHGKFIIQPHALVSYSFVNTFDYTNAAGVRINSDPLHAIQVEPGLKFIGNLKNGWQPYAGISVVWNIMDRTHFQANDVTLPNMSIKPFVKYGVGIRKTWGQRFTGFFQTYFTNGGRNGVGLQAGFRWMLGTDPSPYTKSKKAVSGAAPVTQKTVVKEVKK